MQRFQALRGMKDILPAQIPFWRHLEKVLEQITTAYGYKEIRFPILEATELFERTIGQATDIVEKEMYTFDDHGENVTLRPEGTAGCVRAAIEHGLLHNQIQRLWYQGPMFRHERPSKGRYRQFYQFGVEAFGMPGPDIDAEQIFMMANIWKNLQISDQVVLQINSLGTTKSRQEYRKKLISYFTQHEMDLDDDSRRRLVTNPLRILDSKNPNMQPLIDNAPKLTEFLDDASRKHFEQLLKLLDANQIAYQINPHLVRGLDYYCLTVYEWVADILGSSQQNTVCAGGRYDTLVEQLGGQPIPAVGFALGFERVIAMLEKVYKPNDVPHAYFVLVGDAASTQGLLLAEQLRAAIPELKLVVNTGGGSFNSQFKRADKSGAQWGLILGENELANQTVSVKNLRAYESQQNLTMKQLIEFLRKQT